MGFIGSLVIEGINTLVNSRCECKKQKQKTPQLRLEDILAAAANFDSVMVEKSAWYLRWDSLTLYTTCRPLTVSPPLHCYVQ